MTGHSNIPSTFCDHGDILSSFMPAYDFPSTHASIHLSDVLSTSEVQFDFSLASIPPFDILSMHLEMPYFDIPFGPITPTDVHPHRRFIAMMLCIDISDDDRVILRRRRGYCHRSLSKGWSGLSRAPPSSILIRCMPLNPCILRWSIIYIFKDGVKDTDVDVDADVLGDEGESMGEVWKELDYYYYYYF